METLADFLGLTPAPREQKPTIKLTAREFARGILHSDEYRLYLMDQISNNRLSPQVECLLYHYAYGKPTERVEIKDVTDDVDDMNAEQCEQEARRLINLAQELRQLDARSIH